MISSQDLSRLFNSTRRDAQGLLPQLVRRLIFASCSDSDLSRLEMAAGDDVRLHGWDGVLTYSANHPYIPRGNSVWEMGVSANPETKAGGDYGKRSKNPRGLTPAITTFVFVTPHVWEGRKKWAESRHAEGVWADVQVIDGSILATWLERAPTVALWIADALGRSIRGLRSPDRYWDSAFAHRYAPHITPALIIGGRESAREQLIKFLQSPSGVISLVGETIEEAVLFAVAVCRQSFACEQRSRLLVLSDDTSTEHLATLSQDHIVILTDPVLYPAVRSEALDHLHFVLPEKRDARASRTTNSVDLGALIRRSATSALHEMGLPEEDADRIAGDSKGSLHAVLWMIVEPERGALDWATGCFATELAPLVLAGQWMANEHADHEVIAQLAQRDYPEIKQTLAEWSGPGKPLDRRGALWDWKAWGFAWTRLAPALQRDDVDRFLEITKAVLGAVDPALELPPEERWLANIHGKVSRHSSALREGLAQSVVLLAMNGDLLLDTDGQAAANLFVKSLLQVPEPVKRWISIAAWLPDLAEAAPDAFLDALEYLVNDPAAVKVLFTEGGIFGSSPHTLVLWALERLAWSPGHFGRVVLALARLTAVDPGGDLANRPGSSLRMIMLPWHPATGASVTCRTSALRLLFEQVEPTAWRCAASLLPQPVETSSQFARPKWRTWAKGVSVRMTPSDYWSFLEALVELLLNHAGNHGERWAEVLKAAPELCDKHPELGDKVLDAILGLDPASLARADSRILGEAARSLVMHHDSMHESGWALKGETLKTFRQLSERLRPSLRRDRDRWLFTHWPELPREYDLSEDERTGQLRTLRAEAISAVQAEEGSDALMIWAEEVENPESLGAALAEQEQTPEQEWQLLHTGLDAVGTPTKRPQIARLVYGYVSTKSRAADADWPRSTLKIVSETLGAPAVAFFLQALPCGDEVWALVEDQDNEVRSAYWREIGLHVLTLEECEAVAPRLMDANRPFKVIDLVAMLLRGIRKKDASSEEHGRIVALARAALNAKVDHLPGDEYAGSGSIPYKLDELLSYLESRDVGRPDLARWEWYWLPFVVDSRRGLKSVQVELSESPDLFVELLKCVYRPRNAAESEAQPDDEGQKRAQLAHRALEAWVRTPGLGADAQYRGCDAVGDGLGPISPAWIGIINEEALTAWVDRATGLSVEADRIEMCNQHIGRQFAHAPGDSDGLWPCGAVRRAIERAHNDDIEEGMITGVSNRRGVHYVIRDGVQEVTMANKFREWCERVQLEYPRTGAVLRRLAERYEAESRHEIEQGRFEEFHD